MLIRMRARVCVCVCVCVCDALSCGGCGSVCVCVCGLIRRDTGKGKRVTVSSVCGGRMLLLMSC